MVVLAKARLSGPRQALVELMQQINFGRIENLTIRHREPVLLPRPIVVREIKFGAENGPRPELNAADFLLKRQVVELFDYFDAFPSGVITSLEIHHGLPFRAVVKDGIA